MKNLVPFMFLRVVVSQISGLSNSSNVDSCLLIPGDAAWPSKEVWKAAMPEVETGISKPGKKHPDFRLDATTVDEVIAAVKFAKQHKIRLSVLNSGHDFHGRNDAPSGLALVVTGLRGVRVSNSYVPTTHGAETINSTTKTNIIEPQSGQAYATFGAGLSSQQLTNELARSKLFALGAAHGEVAVAGGWAQTAGHSALSPRYGLGADQPVEYKVVTADGELKVANSVSNPDLFWALRGGGGGTFGVVVEATVKAYPSPPVVTSSFWINTTDANDRKSIYPAVAWLHTKFPEWTEKGLSSFYYVYPNGISLYSMNSGAEGTIEWMNANWKPILQHLGSFPGMDNKTMSYRSIPFPSYKMFFDASWGPIDIPLPGLKGGKPLIPRHGPGEMGAATQAKGVAPMDSWLLASEHLRSPDLAQALEDAMPKSETGQFRGQLIGGGKVLTLGNDTSVLPAWRRTITHIVLTGLGQPDSAPLRRLAPEMGSYVNEASYLTPGWKEAFWGMNYERLSRIKQRYDPDNLFWVTPGINADAWTVKGGRLCRDSTGQRSITRATNIAPASDNINFVDQIKDDETIGGAFPLIHGQNGTIRNPVYPAFLVELGLLNGRTPAPYGGTTQL